MLHWFLASILPCFAPIVANSGKLLRLFPILKSLFVLSAREPAHLFCSAPDLQRDLFLFMKFVLPSKLAGIAAAMNQTTIPD